MSLIKDMRKKDHTTDLVMYQTSGLIARHTLMIALSWHNDAQAPDRAYQSLIQMHLCVIDGQTTGASALYMLMAFHTLSDIKLML